MRGRSSLRLPRVASRRPRRAGPDDQRPPGTDPELLERAQRSTLVLHIGLHKTGSSYVQGLLAARREDLLARGVLYPATGIVDKSAGTREGAGSGHALFSRRGDWQALTGQLLAEVPAAVSTVLVSSEEFSRAARTPTPARLLSRFDAFGTVKVVLVLRRQDDWLESYYKQVVDQYGNFETRSFERYFRDVGRSLVDFHGRFTPWRELVGPDDFHVLSYDDVPDAATLCQGLLEVAGVHDLSAAELAQTSVPRYDSIRSVDTVGLRILNACRLADRDIRTRAARAVYDIAPDRDIELMSADLREEIQHMCRPINERIADEWFGEPVPGFRFGSTRGAPTSSPPSGAEMVDYVDRVLSLCHDARATAQPAAPGGDRA